MTMDPTFASVVITALIAIVALATIALGQKDISVLVLKILNNALDVMKNHK